MWAYKKDKSGFTIVELLVVIVVIAILAAISIVAYNGVQKRARVAAATSALSQAAKLVTISLSDTTGDAPSCAKFNEIITGSTASTDCAFTNKDISYQYKQGVGPAYCITATSGTVSYSITEANMLTDSSCKGHGSGGSPPVTNLVVNPSFETGSGSWSSYYSPTRTQSNEQTRYGSYSQKIVTTSDTQGNGLFSVVTKTYIADTTLRASAWVMAPSGIPYSFSFRSPTQLGNSGWGNVNYVGNGGWQRVEISYVVPASPEAWYAPKVNTRPGYPAIGTAFYVDAVMMSEGDLPADYKDPSIDSNWDWNGTAHSSTSVGPN